MNINVMEVRSKEDVKKFLESTKLVNSFMVDTDMSKLTITKNDFGQQG